MLTPRKLQSRPMRRKPAHQPNGERERHPQALKPLSGVNYGGTTGGPVPKDSPVRNQKLRDSANGEDCLVRILGCPGDSAMTIWSHYRGGAGGKGGAIKSTDIAGAYACTYCDAVYDGQRPRPDGMTKDEVDLAWLEGHIRSLVRLQQKGLI